MVIAAIWLLTQWVCCYGCTICPVNMPNHQVNIVLGAGQKKLIFSAVNLVNSPFLGSTETFYEIAIHKVCNFESIKAENI